MKKTVRKERQEELTRQKRNRRITMILLGIAGLLLIAAGFLATQNEPAAAVAINPNDPQQVALGKKVYDLQCASCHGENLEGEENWQQPGEGGLLKAPPHDETGHTWHHDDAYLMDSVREGGVRLPANVGVSPMPAYKRLLSDAEIAAVFAYIKSAWPADIRQTQATR